VLCWKTPWLFVSPVKEPVPCTLISDFFSCAVALKESKRTAPVTMIAARWISTLLKFIYFFCG
jgi:hypothetical protein